MDNTKVTILDVVDALKEIAKDAASSESDRELAKELLKLIASKGDSPKTSEPPERVNALSNLSGHGAYLDREMGITGGGGIRNEGSKLVLGRPDKVLR
jgi:hypothetical protein